MIWWSSKRHLSTIDCSRWLWNNSLNNLIVDRATDQFNMNILRLVVCLTICAAGAEPWWRLCTKNSCKFLKVSLHLLWILVLNQLLKSFSSFELPWTRCNFAHSYLTLWLLKLRKFKSRLMLQSRVVSCYRVIQVLLIVLLFNLFLNFLIDNSLTIRPISMRRASLPWSAKP